MSQTPANHKELWDLYKIGAAGLDVLAMIVKETDDVLSGESGDGLPKTQSNLAVAIQNAIVKSASGIPKPAEVALASDKELVLDTPPEGLQKRSTGMSVRDIYLICPLLAGFSNRISDYFLAYPIPLDQTAVLNDTVLVSLKEFQKQCVEFQKTCTINPTQFPPEQERLFNRIFTTLQQIIDFPKGPESAIPKLESLELLLTATERILEKLPRYENQTGIMSEKNRQKLSKTQVLAFVERLMRDPGQIDIKYSSDDLEETLEKLWKLSKKLEGQTYNWTRDNEVHLQTSGLQQVIEKGEKRRIDGQDWVNPSIQRNADMELLGQQISNLPKSIESQTYYPTESKQKQMYLSKIEGHLEKLGRPLMAEQRAYSKNEVKNMKFSEVDKILNSVPARFDDQSAIGPGRSLVERNNSERDLNAASSPNRQSSVEQKTLAVTMKEKRKSIQSSIGNAIIKLSGSTAGAPINGNGEIEKTVGSPTKSNLKNDATSPSKETPTLPKETAGEVMISIVGSKNSRLNNQAAEGLNLNDDKQREIINIAHMTLAKMPDQRAEKRNSNINAIKQYNP